MRKALALRAVQNVRRELRKGAGHLANPVDDALGCELQLGGELRPLMRTDLPKPVLASDFHRELQLLQGRLVVRKRARNIVQRREPRPSFLADEDGVVLR